MTSPINNMRGRDLHRKMEREGERGIGREREKWLSVCLYPTVNYLVKVTNLINASLRLSPLSLFFSFFLLLHDFSWSLSPSPSSIFANKWRATMHCVQSFLIACIVAPVPRRLFFSLRYQQGALLIRDIEPYNNDISHTAATALVLCMTWLEPASVIRLASFLSSPASSICFSSLLWKITKWAN